MRKPRSAFLYYPDEPIFRIGCHSSFGGPWPGFTDEERAAFLVDLREAAAFLEIAVVAFSIQPTAFDLILDVPREAKISKKEMLARLKKHTDPNQFAILRSRLDSDPGEWERQASRFGNLGSFVKRLKQLAASRYHRIRGTSGTLWGDRYTRCHVQRGHPTRMLAAWMDHAGVRAGLAENPDGDRWSTFGCAAAGDAGARKMIARLFGEELGGKSKGAVSWRQVAKQYRTFVSNSAEAPDALRSHKGKPLLTRPEFFLTEIAQFRSGIAFGDREFVEGLFELNRNEFGPARRTGARRITGQNDPDLWTLRQGADLRKVIG